MKISGRVQNETNVLEIAERKHMAELYQALAKDLPVGVYVVQDGKFQLVNPRFQNYIGFTEDELLDIDPLSIVHPEDRKWVRECAVAMLKGERQYPYALRVIGKGGKILWAMEAVSSIQYEGKRAALGNFMDVTENKRAEEALRKAHGELEERVKERTLELEKANEGLQKELFERKRVEEALRNANKELRETHQQLIRSEKLVAIGQLAGGVGHELRNPLGAIKNAVYYIKGKMSEGDLWENKTKVMEFLEIIDEEINASNKIINDLLGLSRVGKPAISSVKVEKVINDTLSCISIPKNIELVEKIDAELPEVDMDTSQIRQVLVNVINNAVQAMPEGGRLLIEAKEKQDLLELAIADTGNGISKETIGKIFDPLFTTRARGIGLGLAVCKAIIERHKGRIEVESEVGKGAVFSIKMPLKTDGAFLD